MKARYLFILAVICASTAILGLRVNAQRSLELKNQIIQKDLSGQNTKNDIEQLRQFVFSHMNTSVEFELVGAYERAVTNSRQAGVSGELYRQAQTACDRQGVSSVEQAVCVQNYLDKRLVGEGTETDLPPRSQFRYAFAAPAWSADLGGWGILGTIVFLVWAVVIYIKNLFRFRLASAE